MAQPTPIFVTPSTSLVQVNNLQNPYTPVILSNLGYTGQTVSIKDETGVNSILYTPIVISTINTTKFINNATSTLIQQPNGFVTLQSQLPDKWNFLNSYPFRDQYISAGVLNITASTVTTFTISSAFQNTNLLYVENLTIISSFQLNDNIVLIPDVIAKGDVVFNSSLAVLDNAYFSSDLYVYGKSEFFSSIIIYDNLNVSSSIETTSSVYVSSALYVLGNISTPFINLFGGLDVPYAEIQRSTMDSLNVAGSVLIGSNISTLSSVIVGGTYNTNTLYAASSIIYSSFAITNGISTYTSSIFNTLSTLGEFVLKNNLVLGNELNVKNNLYGLNNLYINKDLTITSNLEIYTLDLERVSINGSFSSFSSIVIATSASSIRDIYTEDANLSSIDIHGGISSLSNIVINGNFTVNGDSLFGGSISSYNGGEVYRNLSVSSNANIQENINVSTSAIFKRDLEINGTFSTNIDSVYPYSTIIYGDVSIEGSLYSKGVVYTSTINLGDFLTTKNVIVDRFSVDYIGIVSSQNISSLVTSSIITGGGSNTEYAFTLNNTLSTPSISTNNILTNLLNINRKNDPNSFLYITSSFGVNIDSIIRTNTFYVNRDAYLLSSTRVYEQLSTKNVIANEMIGVHEGDGTFLSNIAFPAKLSTIFVSSLTTAAIEYYTSSLYTSTFNVRNYMFANSTIQINGINIFGNASLNFTTAATNINAIYSDDPTRLYLNNLLSYYSANDGQKKAYINVANPNYNSPYTLEVGGTLSVSSISSTNFAYSLSRLGAREIFVSSFNVTNPGNILISSGVLSFSTSPFMFTYDRAPTLLPREISTNVIVSPTGALSSLVFNNTLYVNRANRRVGVGRAISAPTYNLDVQSTIYCNDGALFTNLNISDKIVVNQQTSTLFIAGSSNIPGVTSNISYSADGNNWITYANINGMTVVNSVGYNGKLWVLIGSATASNFSIQYSSNLPTWQTTTGTLFTPNFPGRNIAWNGSIWVAVGASGITPSRTIVWSSNASNWSPSDTGGFNRLLSNTGGYAVGWNGNIWVAGGIGDITSNSLLYSSDGSNWLNSATGGFDTFDLVWADRVWVAVGRSSVLGGIQIKKSEDGKNWSTSLLESSGGPANAIGYGNGTLVVLRSNATANTILYSVDFGNTWSNGSGTLFSGQGISITWNGTYWLAGGNDGLRKSYDGINWFTPVTAPNQYYSALAYSSNNTPLISVGYPSTNILVAQSTSINFFNDPLPGILTQTRNTLSFTSTFLSFNNALHIYSSIAISVPYPLTKYEIDNCNYTSTFVINGEVAKFNNILNAPQIRTGALYMATQVI